MGIRDSAIVGDLALAIRFVKIIFYSKYAKYSTMMAANIRAPDKVTLTYCTISSMGRDSKNSTISSLCVEKLGKLRKEGI